MGVIIGDLVYKEAMRQPQDPPDKNLAQKENLNTQAHVRPWNGLYTGIQNNWLSKAKSGQHLIYLNSFPLWKQHICLLLSFSHISI